MHRFLAVGLALATTLATVSPSAAASDVRALPVPYRSQLDGSASEGANCGPSSIGMVLDAYGQAVPTRQIRQYVNAVQNTEGEDDAGSFIESLWDAAEHYGLRPSGLFAGARGERGKTALRRWSMDGVRRELDAGHPLVPQVQWRGLPGRGASRYEGDHYIVLTGYTVDGVIYHDPMDYDGPGASRRMSWVQLDRAWGSSLFPYAAFSIEGSAARPSLLARPAVTPSGPGSVRGPLGSVWSPPAPGDIPLAAYPGTWRPEIAGAP